MCSLCHDRNSWEDETCNSRSVPVNIRFKYHIWKPSLRRQKSNRFNNNFARASRFFVHFFAVTARLRHESALLWRAKTQYSDFLFLFLNFDTVFRRTEREEIIPNTLFKWLFCSCRHRCCLSSLGFLSESVEWNFVTSFTKFDQSVIFSPRSKCGTWENKNSRASDKANIRESHVSTPHEFLVTNIVGFCAISNPLCFLFQYIQPPPSLCFLSL